MIRNYTFIVELAVSLFFTENNNAAYNHGDLESTQCIKKIIAQPYYIPKPIPQNTVTFNLCSNGAHAVTKVYWKQSINFGHQLK